MKRDFSQILLQIKEQYRYEDDDQLLWLLEGLADPRAKGVVYWDYIEVETLLSLQKTKTTYPDEVIFITYHQIHELYFKLIIQELRRIVCSEKNIAESDAILKWQTALGRVTRYFHKLIESFDVLKFGLDEDEFKAFRKALLPASGFQTHQFRLIEIMLTPFQNLIGNKKKESLPRKLILDEHFKHIYWRSAVLNPKSGKEAKILENFNRQYDESFKRELYSLQQTNIYSRYIKASRASKVFKSAVMSHMINLEESILVWKIAHLKTVARHLPNIATGTGTLPWKEYLSLANQQIYYFPLFWSHKNLNFNTEIERMMASVVDKITEQIKIILE